MANLREQTQERMAAVTMPHVSWVPPVVPPPPGPICPGPMPGPGPHPGDNRPSGLAQYPTAADFPDVGSDDILYIDRQTQKLYFWKDNGYFVVDADCDCDCGDVDIDGSILYGGNAYGDSGEIDPRPPRPSKEITAENIINALGYTPANINDVMNRIHNATSTIETALSRETAERAAADTAEAQTRAKAINAEARAREDAIEAEKRERRLADENEAIARQEEDLKIGADVASALATVQEFEEKAEELENKINAVANQSVWEKIVTYETSKEQSTIALQHLNLRKARISISIVGSPSNMVAQRLDINLNRDDPRWRIASMNSAIQANSVIGYTTLSANVLSGGRIGGYINNVTTSPDTNSSLVSLSTQTALGEEINFGSSIDAIYLHAGDIGKFGIGTKVEVFGIKNN